jgi:GNAT superfamily N-acetyltransferase
MASSSLRIRRIAESDLGALDACFRSEFDRTHRDDLLDQQRERISFYVAFVSGEPVAHGLVRWLGPRDPATATLYPDTPEIYRLNVMQTHRARGIGTQLVGACEQEARQREFRSLGLAVDDTNPRARALYLRLGYAPSKMMHSVDRYCYRLPNGEIQWVEEPGAFLVKAT